MENIESIKELLVKFKLGILSPQESHQLLTLLKNGDNDQRLKEAINSFWEENLATSDIPTAKLWARINSELEKDLNSGSKPIFQLIYPFLKYAAIIVITISLTLFAGKLLNKQSISHKVSPGLRYNEVSVSFGSKSRIILPDGSMVVLNSGSILKYPSDFESVGRNVYLEGEGYFEVKKDASHPFLVKTKGITVRVLGTKFNVKSYNDEKTIETTLVSGSVEILLNNNNSAKQKILLTPNQQALFFNETNTIDVQKTDESVSNIADAEIEGNLKIQTKVDIAQVISWKDNRLVFRNENFVELTHKLERWYDVKIEIKDEELKRILFSGTFQKESIEQALNALKIITPFHYEMKMNQIIITKNY